MDLIFLDNYEELIFFAICTGLARPPSIDLDQKKNPVITGIKENNIRLLGICGAIFLYFPAKWVTTLVVNISSWDF